MMLALAMIVSYLPFFAWVLYEAHRQKKENQKTH